MPSSNRCGIAAFLVALAIAPVASTSAADEKERAALDAAKAWLERVDAGDYAASWTEAAGVFRSAVSKESWAQQAGAVRRPLGKVLERKLKSASYQTSLPGAPDGEYVVIQYQTAFANKRSAVETVTPMRDADGRWRVSGYYVR